MPKNGKSKAVAVADSNPNQPKGWDLLQNPTQLVKAHNYTGARIAKCARRKQAIVEALSLGMPMRLIAKAFDVHTCTVAAIARAEPMAVEAGKHTISKRCMATAGLVIDSYLSDLAAGVVRPESKPISAAVFIDKSLALAGQATTVIEHRRSEAPSPTKVNGFWDVEVEVLPPSDPQSPAPGPEPRQIGPAPTQDTALDTAPEPTVVPVEPAAPEAPPATTAPDRPPGGGRGGGPPPPAPDGL